MGNAQQSIESAFDPARAVIYGQIVEIAYKMFECNPNNPTPPVPACAAFPAGYKFVGWVQMRDFTSSGPDDYMFYGLIASNSSKPNENVLAIRGTEGWIEWLDDATNLFAQVPLPADASFGHVGYGFYTIYKTLRVFYPLSGDGLVVESLEPAGSFVNQVAEAIRRHSGKPGESTPTVVTGHSLGAALATIHVVENFLDPKTTIPLICTFASPRVGDSVFASKFDQLGINSWRVVNEPDFVPKLPFLGYRHVGKEYLCNSLSSVVFSLGCFHYLETYLHLLDPKQPLKDKCILPPRVAAAGPLRSPTRLAPAAAALSPPPTHKEIELSVPQEAGTTINITIKIG